MKVWITILLLFLLMSITFVIGFYKGFNEGYIAKEKENFESCNFIYDPLTNTYKMGININISALNFSNGTS